MGIRRRLRRSSTVSSDSMEVLIKNHLEDEPKVLYAKRKKPESRFSLFSQFICVLIVIVSTGYTYHYFDHFHHHITHLYGHHLDDPHAQHQMGHKLLKQDGHNEEAFKFFRRSADQGHPESAYNLAAGHLSGYKTDVKKGEVKQLLQYAASKGVDHAQDLLDGLCRDQPKHCEH